MYDKHPNMELFDLRSLKSFNDETLLFVYLCNYSVSQTSIFVFCFFFFLGGGGGGRNMS